VRLRGEVCATNRMSGVPVKLMPLLGPVPPLGEGSIGLVSHRTRQVIKQAEAGAHLHLLDCFAVAVVRASLGTRTSLTISSASSMWFSRRGLAYAGTTREH